MEGQTPPTPLPVYRVYEDHDPPPGYPNLYVYQDGNLILRLRGNAEARSRATGGPVEWTVADPDAQQQVLRDNRLRIMAERMTEAPGTVQDEEPQQQPVEQQQLDQQPQPIRHASPRQQRRVAYHREWPEVYRLLESRYPGMERQLSAPDPSKPFNHRFEVIIMVEYQCVYKMHYDRPLEVKEYYIKFRSGPKIGCFHDIQFSSPTRITQWHGVWSYDDMMQEWRGSFRYDWPDSQALKWSNLSRDGPVTWRGLDQEGRSIEMVLKVVRYFCRPAENYISYKVLPNGEMIRRTSQ